MNSILQRLQQTLNWKELMRSSCRKNGLNTSHAGQLTILKLKQLSQRFQRSYQSLREKLTNLWIQNELKAYNWVLIALSLLDDLKIEEFGQQQWNILQKIFRYKSQIFLKYQARKLITRKSKKNKNWSVEQNELLKQIVIKCTDRPLPWNDIGRQLFHRSEEKIFRTGKHCRERWLNHLDPSKQRGVWMPEEDLILLHGVLKSGKKWSELAASLKRTEHMVKNRFNSMVIKQKKLTPQFKKQEKLIAQIIKNLTQGHGYAQISQEQHRDIEQELQPQDISQESAQYNQNIIAAPKLHQKKQIPVHQNAADPIQKCGFLGIDGIQQYVRQDLEFKNSKNAEFGQLYSPFWTYSPNNATPTNLLGSSPSPLSYYVSFNFANCFSRFTNQINSLSSITSLNTGASSSREQPSDIN